MDKQDGIIAVLIILIITIMWYKSLEHMNNKVENEISHVYLYDTYRPTVSPGDGLHELDSPSDIHPHLQYNRSWGFSGNNVYNKELVPIQLKTFDIKVVKSDNKHKRVELWALYPNDTVASSVATGVSTNAYIDPFMSATYDHTPYENNYQLPASQIDLTNSYKINSDYGTCKSANMNLKYKKIAEVRPGEHIKGEVAFPVKRVMVIAIL